MGMDGLYHILCEMRRDIKKVSDAQSLDGAKKWAKKKGDGYEATVDDLNDDGIEEVVVHDPYGNPVMINGYTTKDSEWPTNHAYFSMYPDKRERKENSRKSYMDTQYDVSYPFLKNPGKVEFKNIPEWVRLAAEHNYKVSKPRDKTAYQMFSSDIVKSALDTRVANIIEVFKTTDGEERKRLLKKGFIKIAAYMWKWGVLRPAIVKALGAEYDEVFMEVEKGKSTDTVVLDMYKKIKSNAQVKKVCKELVNMLVYFVNSTFRIEEIDYVSVGFNSALYDYSVNNGIQSNLLQTTITAENISTAQDNYLRIAMDIINNPENQIRAAYDAESRERI